MADAPLRVLHVITTLQVGGAERLLQHLVAASDPGAFAHSVVSLTGEGPVADALREAGVPVRALGLRRPADGPAALAALLRGLRAERPHVVHTWMVHANAIGGVVAAARRLPLLWSVHHDHLDPSARGRRTRAVERVNAALARRLPDRVVCTSASSRDAAVQRGYPAARLAVIANGVPPLDAPADRATARALLGLPAEALLVGRVARFAPQKDHESFLRAVGAVRAVRPDVVGVLAGHGCDAENPELHALIAAHCPDGVVLLGEEHRVGALHRSLDVEVSSSAFGETTPLVLAEAMSLGVPVVTTDVGDCAAMVEGVGSVVPPRDAADLAAAVLDALGQVPAERELRAERGRQRVLERYSSTRTARAYEELYQELAGGRGYSPAR